MAEKLKSILRQTRWSLLLKGAVFAVAWFFLPWWLFAIAALYLYFIPATGAGTVAAPFFTLLAISFFEPTSIWMALIFGAIFVYLLFIKDLLIIDRRTAYEMASVALTFLLFRDFYLQQGGNFAGSSLFWMLAAAAIVGMLVAGLIKQFPDGATEDRRIRRLAGWSSFLIAAQFLFAGLLLPIDFVGQLAVGFLAAVVLIDFIPKGLSGNLTRERVFMTSGVAFALLVLMLAGAQWQL